MSSDSIYTSSKDISNNSEILISVKNVGKVFCRDFKKSLVYGLKDSSRDLFHSKNKRHRNDRVLRSGEFWANKGISFELKRGECLGLIGKNGAGKTTLLKILNGLIKPDFGSVQVRGRVGALIALGAGFNPILTGRENIFINGSILGLSKKEISEKVDEIIEFAEIEEAIDSPVQSYSSGMQVRLGFSIATTMNVDVLLIDEVLAVGDVEFRVKCYNRLRDLMRDTAIIFVSHNMYDITKVCNRVGVCNSGKLLFLGDVSNGISLYNKINCPTQEESENLRIIKEDFLHEVSFSGSTLRQESKGWRATFDLTFESEICLPSVAWRIAFFDAAGIFIAEWHSLDYEKLFTIQVGNNKVSLEVEELRLVAGKYEVALVLTDNSNTGYFLRIDRGINLIFSGRGAGGPAYRV